MDIPLRDEPREYYGPRVAEQLPPSYAHVVELPANAASQLQGPSQNSFSPPPYSGRADALPPPEYSEPRGALSREQQLRMLGVAARGDLQRALVVGDRERALRLCASAKRSLSGLSALHPGALWGDTDVGATDLHVAVLFGELEVTEALLPSADINAMCNINATYGDRASSLHFAIAIRNTAMVQLLLENGAVLMPKKMKTKTGYRFSYYAPAVIAMQPWLDLTEPVQPEECIEMLTTFLSLGWKVNTSVDSISRTMLHHVVRLPQDRAYLRNVMASFLLEHGADVLATSINGSIPLHFAARSNESPDIVRKLLQRDQTQQVLAKDDYGNTVLHEAIWSRRSNGSRVSLDILNQIIMAGADVNEKTRKGETPIALARDDVEVVELLGRDFGGTL